MHLANLRAVGGSVMVAIPRSLLEVLGLRADTKVGLSIDKGKLVIEPSPKPSYTLAELVAQCQVNAVLSDEEKQWLGDGAVGNEDF